MPNYCFKCGSIYGSYWKKSSETEIIPIDEKGVPLHVGVSGLVVDTALSDISTNPVQNKVIKTAVDGKPVFTSSLESDEQIKKGQPVYIKNNGHIGLANASVYSSANVAGLAYTDCEIGFACQFTALPSLELANWTEVTGEEFLTIGNKYYLSNISGKLTDTAITLSEQLVVYIGKAVSTTVLCLNVERPILL